MLLVYWYGNASAVHRQLVARAETGSHGSDGQPMTAAESAASPAGASPIAVPLLGPPASLSTFLRAVRRDLMPGERAGLAGGERAARKHDVFLVRPRPWRNEVWEVDHIQASVLVDVDGKARRPWITWFTDCATNSITGVAVTLVHPSRESVLAALRAAVLRGVRPLGFSADRMVVGSPVQSHHGRHHRTGPLHLFIAQRLRSPVTCCLQRRPRKNTSVADDRSRVGQVHPAGPLSRSPTCLCPLHPGRVQLSAALAGTPRAGLSVT
ncbi:hypothetical protein [Streptomyces sp. NPDC059176]|uniref:hypothetical protein n=1 Tax=Streptomyces sp. NPDC059176 TaxID=3346758 RepID=UPI00368352BB